MNILWCVTGAGHLLEESCLEVERLSRKHDITVAFSRAGREVALMYGLSARFKRAAVKVVYEEAQGFCSPFVVHIGRFGLVVLSPCTANTTAKVALGIADSLISNVASQALKSGRRVAVVPTDIKRVVETAIPSGKRIRIRCRGVDVRSARALGREKNVVVLEKPGDVSKLLKDVD